MQIESGEVLSTNQFMCSLHVKKIRDIKNMKISVLKQVKEKLIALNSAKEANSSSSTVSDG